MQLQPHACGETLPFTQAEVKFRGHAIECRIYAEDPDNNYFPSPGKITKLAEPSGTGIRLDSGIYEGWNVPLEYDPLLAKLIGYGESREQAIGRVQRALGEYFIAGVKTNLSLFRRILKDADFLAGSTHTGLLDRMPEQASSPQMVDESIVAIAAGIFSATSAAQTPPDTNNDGAFTSQSSAWKKIARTEALS